MIAGVGVKRRSGRVTKIRDNFLHRLFYFFESISQIRESEQKLGRMPFSQVTFCCGMTP
jgi:hypothetical protein